MDLNNGGSGSSSSSSSGGGGESTKLVNEKGQFDVDEKVWGLLGVVWPRPGEYR